MRYASRDVIAVVAERVAGILGPHRMRFLARFHKRVTNPILRRRVTRLPNMAVIEHRGRTSGRRYQTPVMAFIDGDELLVVLNYGTNSDWVRNVVAAGSASVRYHGRCYRLNGPRVIPIDAAGVPAALQATHTPQRFALHGRLVPAEAKRVG